MIWSQISVENPPLPIEILVDVDDTLIEKRPCPGRLDITIEHIGDILTFDLAALLGSKTTSSAR